LRFNRGKLQMKTRRGRGKHLDRMYHLLNYEKPNFEELRRFPLVLSKEDLSLKKNRIVERTKNSAQKGITRRTDRQGYDKKRESEKREKLMAKGLGGLK